ncbi:hypothetical protein RG836_23965 [Pseudomonas sp. SZMC_28357]|uniref:hypothetical protein n=1 Tax=Pseudomonas sp. SZMC_28357 TaxID=3074380 RepID=UPI00287239B9|nr:hypothetical protein [Pseudomonas sp. SZMC_28357]MDR9754502.1 hypothetical protein [Pseudomonas sp. SZMC_28357]
MSNKSLEPLEFEKLKLDLSFGDQGVVSFPGLKGQCRTIALDGSSRLVVAIWTYPDTEVFRLNADGSVDRDFGMNGSVLVQFEAGFNSVVSQIFIQPDGKILLSGLRRQPDKSIGLPALARLMEDGKPDPEFGVDGKVVLRVDTKDLNLTTRDGGLVQGQPGQFWMTFPYSVIDPSGIGVTTTLLLRIDGATGQLLSQRPLQHRGISTNLNHISITADNKILLSGDTDELVSGLSIRRILLTRYDLDGWSDPSFGDRGSVWFGPESGNYSTGHTLSLDAGNGEYTIMVFGSDNHKALAMRFMASGQPDIGFNNGQPRFTEIEGGLYWGFASRLSSGKLLLFGGISGDGIETEFCVARMLEDGILDTTFSKEGWKLGPDRTSIWGMVLQHDGRLVVAADDNTNGSVPKVFGFQL